MRAIWRRAPLPPLAQTYVLTSLAFRLARPLLEIFGLQRVERVLTVIEAPTKRLLLDCRMCGQCTLHQTGMICPMTCPKNIRNGPCGGVRADETCEVTPTMRCVWVDAVERAARLPKLGAEIHYLQPPLDARLAGRSAWIVQLEQVAEVAVAGPPSGPLTASR